MFIISCAFKSKAHIWKNHPWNLYENINSKIWELHSHKCDLFLLSHLQLNIQPQHPGEPKVTWWNVFWGRAS